MSWQLGVGHCVALASLNLSFLWGELCKITRWLLGKMAKNSLGLLVRKSDALLERRSCWGPEAMAFVSVRPVLHLCRGKCDCGESALFPEGKWGN